MPEVQLSKRTLTKPIVTLDANTIGYYTPSGFAGGLHVGHIKAIGITTDNRGKHTLRIETELMTFMKEDIDENQVEKAREWVADVQRAIQSTAL